MKQINTTCSVLETAREKLTCPPFSLTTCHLGDASLAPMSAHVHTGQVPGQMIGKSVLAFLHRARKLYIEELIGTPVDHRSLCCNDIRTNF